MTIPDSKSEDFGKFCASVYVAWYVDRNNPGQEPMLNLIKALPEDVMKKELLSQDFITVQGECWLATDKLKMIAGEMPLKKKKKKGKKRGKKRVQEKKE